jgi:hypothetical protein
MFSGRGTVIQECVMNRESLSQGLQTDDKSSFMKRVGVWGFAFFAVKGMFWLLLPVAVAWLGVD